MLDESCALMAYSVFPPPQYITEEELPVATVLEVTPATTVGAIKVMLKAPPECTIFFSAVYNVELWEAARRRAHAGILQRARRRCHVLTPKCRDPPAPRRRRLRRRSKRPGKPARSRGRHRARTRACRETGPCSMCLVMMSYLVDARTLLCISSKDCVSRRGFRASLSARVRARSR